MFYENVTWVGNIKEKNKDDIQIVIHTTCRLNSKTVLKVCYFSFFILPISIVQYVSL